MTEDDYAEIIGLIDDIGDAIVDEHPPWEELPQTWGTVYGKLIALRHRVRTLREQSSG